MEAVELMYYTLTAALIVFILAMLFVIYQLSLLFTALRMLIFRVQNFPLFAKIATGTVQATLLSLVLKLFKRR